MIISHPPAHLNAALQDLARRYSAAAQQALGPQLVSLALYGSAARGQALPTSGIDLFVVLADAPAGMLARRRLLEPIREGLTPELEDLWRQGIYTDFIEVIRSRREAERLSSLYLDMSQEAVLLYDRDRFLHNVLERVRRLLRESGAERHAMGRHWYWDLKQDFAFGEIV